MYGLNKWINRACRIYGRTAARLRKHRVILCYHNVGAAGRGYLGDTRSIPAADFEAQMRWLKANVDVVSLDEITSNGSLARHQVAITFDDGYLNNVETVMPIMQDLGLPMTWFVATKFVDNADKLPWWDMIDLLMQQSSGSVEFTEAEVRGVYDLSKEQDRTWLNKSLRAIVKSVPRERRDVIIAELAQQLARHIEIPANAFARPSEIAAIEWDGLEIGGHTVSHPNLATCEPTSRLDELQTGKNRLEQISGQKLNWFAYPFGGPDTYDTATAEAVRESGFRGAVTLDSGLVSKNINPYMLPRLAISPKLSLPDFKARVAGAPIFVRGRGLRNILARLRG